MNKTKTVTMTKAAGAAALVNFPGSCGLFAAQQINCCLPLLKLQKGVSDSHG